MFNHQERVHKKAKLSSRYCPCLVTVLSMMLVIGGVPGLFEAIASSPDAAVASSGQGDYTGSASCRDCHERFYKLWAPSHHGTAMQLYNDHFAASHLTPQENEITIASRAYHAAVGKGQGWVEEKTPEGASKLPIKYVLGGKNVFYFLTPLEKGKLQTLPLAYDVNLEEWFDTAASGVRHVADQPLNWRDSSFTFNTTCRGCHVSQFSLNYDLENNAYHTAWAEPGINCETCHGPGGAHVKVCQEAPEGTVPNDLKISRGGRDFTHDQNNATCSSCHAKAVPLTQSYTPGDPFWDHYDLVTLEHGDYYPDGRDLGENYTFTSWRMSPCVQSGQLDCLHCHTSSGRFSWRKNPSDSCLPCHAERVRDIETHSRHKIGPETPTCISCHMPMTGFARMKRSDHSMLPPTPAATIACNSPNACNICHQDKDAAWADRQVRAWHGGDYQAPILHRAGLIDAARKGDWSRLSDILTYLNSEDQDAVFAASLIRLLRYCQGESKWPTVVKAASSSSPLVRAAAVESLQDMPSSQTAAVLQKALVDPTRLVRIRAAQALASYPRQLLQPDARKSLEQATKEMLESHAARPDAWSAHYNIGNFYLDQGRPQLALAAYDTSLRLEPRAVRSLVNSALAHGQLGQKEEAEARVEKALEFEPDNAPAHFNLGLLKVELNKPEQAEEHLRLALQHDPTMSQAAYNLGLLVFPKSPNEGLELCRKAFQIAPTPRYAYAIAQLLLQQKELLGAEETLELIMQRWPGYSLAYLLLADVHSRRGQRDQAVSVLQKGMQAPGVSPRDQLRLAAKLQTLEEKKGEKPPAKY